ncbi:hypothetical protein ES705_07961 [subsurface metagenome]
MQKEMVLLQIGTSYKNEKMIAFNSINSIKNAGFKGFISISELQKDSNVIPKTKGVYLVLYTAKKVLSFLNIGTGGHFKGKNPNINIDELRKNWIENTIVIYIGKAGSSTTKATLNSRIQQYLKFGQGRNIGHWGGRLIWQIENSGDLTLCWKPLKNEEPRDGETELIQQFKSIYGKRPFANLSD